MQPSYEPFNESGTMLPPDPEMVDAIADTEIDGCALENEEHEHVHYVPANAVIDPPYYTRNPDGTKTPITKAEYKKGMREQYTAKHNINPTCGHKVVVGHEPRHRNCEACWFAYFQIHGQITKIADEIFQKHGAVEGGKIITDLKGKKFFENFTRFMSTVAKWKADMEAAVDNEEQDEQPTSGTETITGEESSTVTPGTDADTADQFRLF